MAVFVGDTMKIILNVGVDISSATLRQIKYRDPSGKFGVWTASQETTKSISKTTIATEAGNWLVQAYIETPDWNRHGEIVSFQVENTLETMQT